MKIFINIKEKSERLPNKNFLDFGESTLYEHTIRKFILSGHSIYIDTDSQHIIDNVNKKYSSFAEAYQRLPEHIEMENPGILMTQRFLDEYVTDDDEPIMVIHVTSPFVRVESINEALELWQSGKYDSICSVNVIRNFCLRKSYHDGKEVKYVPLNFDFRHVPRTQDLEPIYEINHAFFMFSKRTMKRYDNRIGASPYFYELKYPENIDIDTKEDFDLALHVLNCAKK